jgi:hypothetical protein
VISISLIRLCLTKLSEIGSLVFHLVGGRDPTIVDFHSKVFIRNGLPILLTLVSFWHFAIVRQQRLTPSIAFTSILGDRLIGFVRGVLTNITFLCSFRRDEICAQCFT